MLRALKLLCFPPKGMTAAEAAHEASKIIASGVVLALGVYYEQAVETFISAMPILKPLADILSVVVVGGMTALASSIVIYFLDKIDAFHVMDTQRHAYMMNVLEEQIEELNKENEALIEQIMAIV